MRKGRHRPRWGTSKARWLQSTPFGATIKEYMLLEELKNNYKYTLYKMETQSKESQTELSSASPLKVTNFWWAQWKPAHHKAKKLRNRMNRWEPSKHKCRCIRRSRFEEKCRGAAEGPSPGPPARFRKSRWQSPQPGAPKERLGDPSARLRNLRSPAKSEQLSVVLIGKPTSWQKAKVLTSKQHAPKFGCLIFRGYPSFWWLFKGKPIGVYLLWGGGPFCSVAFCSPAKSEQRLVV